MKPLPPVLKRKLDIEPLSEARWTRVERAVLDAASTEIRRTPEALPAAPPPRWRLTAAMLVLAGALAAIAGGFAWRAVMPEAREGATRVETAANGSRVEFGESTIDVGPMSAVRLAGDDTHGVVVTLDRGRVECDVAPRRERPPFVVESGSVEVRVIGTHFAVTRTGDTATVEVQRGEVEVTSSGDRFLVPAGSRWPPPETATAPAASGASGAWVPSALPSATDSREAGAARVPAEAHGGAPNRASGPGSGSPRDQYEAASRLEASQPATAIALYRDLARQGGAWGQNALFAEGRLEADRGNDDDARRLLRDYLARYPGGPNANDARQLVERLR